MTGGKAQEGNTSYTTNTKSGAYESKNKKSKVD